MRSRPSSSEESKVSPTRNQSPWHGLSPRSVVERARPRAAEGSDEVFLFDERAGKYYGLGHAGSRIWRLLEEPCAVHDLCDALEAELAELDPREQLEFAQDLGLEEPGLNRLVRATYELLGLITFFTTGDKETRAWTVPRGTRAPEAGGIIHTDFERGFIRAETIGWDEFVAVGSLKAARERGLIRSEGRDYEVRDGELIHFRFNV